MIRTDKGIKFESTDSGKISVKSQFLRYNTFKPRERIFVKC